MGKKFMTTQSTVIALLVLVVAGITGCGKKAIEPKSTTPNFDHPSATLLQDIARKNGWQIEDVEARRRAFDALESNEQPADADWQQLVKAADLEKNGFDLSLVMEFSRHMTDKYRASILKWCERNMEQTEDPDAAVIGYDCYVRSGGSEKDLWANRLKARGQFYVEKITEGRQTSCGTKCFTALTLNSIFD